MGMIWLNGKWSIILSMLLHEMEKKSCYLLKLMMSQKWNGKKLKKRYINI